MQDYGFLEDWPLSDPDHSDSWFGQMCVIPLLISCKFLVDAYKSSIEHLENPTDFNILVNTHTIILFTFYIQKSIIIKRKKKKWDIKGINYKIRGQLYFLKRNWGSTCKFSKRLGVNLQFWKILWSIVISEIKESWSIVENFAYHFI